MMWTAEYTEELLRLIWTIERTVALGPQLDAVLSAAVEGPTFTVEELPQPDESERRPPG